MSLTLLYISECPSWQIALENLRVAVGSGAEIELHEITSGVEALAKDFGGSPTITRGGQDIFGHPQPVDELACRVYVTPEGLKGAPTIDMIRQALTART